MRWIAACLALVALCGGCKARDGEDPCSGITCSGHGRCVVIDGEPVCECDAGYEPDGLSCVPTTGESTTDQIVKDGVTWTFDDLHPYGRYANGDYWVLGPVTITRIRPDFGGEHHGWEVNPSDTVAQGFDERIHDFDAARVPDLPYVAQPGESIVKAVSLEPLGDDECRPCLQSSAVLTVVGEAPPDDGETVFRPPYFGTDKPLYSTEDLQTDLLPSYPHTENTPSLDDVEGWFRGLQLDHKTNWTGRAMHPVDSMPDYGSSIASRDAEGALRLMMDDTVLAKWDAIVVYVQFGIDIYHMMLGGQVWPPGGGHGEGRKLPAVFAAVLLDDEQMRTDLSSAGREVFGENGGMYRSPADVVLFGQTDNDEESYWTNLVFDTGSRTIIDPYHHIDGGHRPGGSYQFCCTSLPWKSTATALYMMPALQDVWNHPEFLEYVDRWVSHGAWTQPDPCAPPDGTCSGGDSGGAACTSASEPDVCTGEEAFCDLTVGWDAGYGVTYGPDGSGGCIPDADESDGTGRFPALHGASRDDGHYGSAFANELWSTYVE